MRERERESQQTSKPLTHTHTRKMYENSKSASFLSSYLANVLWGNGVQRRNRERKQERESGRNEFKVFSLNKQSERERERECVFLYFILFI